MSPWDLGLPPPRRCLSAESYQLFDAPGVAIYQEAGRVIAAIEVFNFTLSVTVSNGSQSVECPTVQWQAWVMLGTNKQGKLQGAGSAYVVGVIP